MKKIRYKSFHNTCDTVVSIDTHIAVVRFSGHGWSLTCVQIDNLSFYSCLYLCTPGFYENLHPYLLTSISMHMDTGLLGCRYRLLWKTPGLPVPLSTNLTLIYKKQGWWKEAEVLEVQVIIVKTRVLGVEHPSTW